MQAVCVAIFYIQKCLFLYFLQLHSPLYALKKYINILFLLYKKFVEINLNNF